MLATSETPPQDIEPDAPHQETTLTTEEEQERQQLHQEIMKRIAAGGVWPDYQGDGP